MGWGRSEGTQVGLELGGAGLEEGAGLSTTWAGKGPASPGPSCHSEGVGLERGRGHVGSEWAGLAWGRDRGGTEAASRPTEPARAGC